MSEPDDVERLVGRIEAEARAEVADPDDVVSGEDVLRLARIVRELLAEQAELTDESCEFYPFYKRGCRDGQPLEPEGFCPPCRARALRERLNRLARGEA